MPLDLDPKMAIFGDFRDPAIPTFWALFPESDRIHIGILQVPKKGVQKRTRFLPPIFTIWPKWPKWAILNERQLGVWTGLNKGFKKGSKKGYGFWPKMGQKWVILGSKMGPFLTPFRWDLEGFWAQKGVPKWAHFWPKNGSKNGPKNGPKKGSFSCRTPATPGKKPFKMAYFGLFWGPGPWKGVQNGPFLTPFWALLGPFGPPGHYRPLPSRKPLEIPPILGPFGPVWPVLANPAQGPKIPPKKGVKNGSFWALGPWGPGAQPGA